MVAAIVKRCAPFLWCMLLVLLASAEPTLAQEATPDEPGGIVYAAWGILITIFVLIPIGSTWLCSHFIMEDDRLRFALMLYVFYVVLFALTTVGFMWVEDFAVDDRWLAGLVYAGIISLFLVALLAIPMKVYYAAIHRALALIVFTVVCMAAAYVGTTKGLDGLPAGDKFNEMFGEHLQMKTVKQAWMRAGLEVYGLYAPEKVDQILASAGIDRGSELQNSAGEETSAFPEMKMKPKSDQPTERQAPKIYSAYSTPPKEEKTETVDETPVSTVDEEEQPATTALAQSAPSGPSFEVGQKVAMLKELIIPTEYGDLKIRKGDEVKLVREAGSGEWIVKRGVMQFRVQAVDLRATR